MTTLRRAAALQVAATVEAKRAKGKKPRPPGEYGPEVRIASGRVEVVDAADPDAPDRTIRRARVADPIARMKARGELSKALAEAADELRALAEAAQYASRSSLGALDRIPGGFGPGLPPPSVARAAARFARAMLAAWPYGPVLVWVVLDNRTVGSYATAVGVKPVDAMTALREALRLLASHLSIEASQFG